MPDELQRTAPPVREASAWRRLWAWLRAVEETLNTVYDDIQDRRILALERDVAGLRAAMGAPRADAVVAE